MYFSQITASQPSSLRQYQASAPRFGMAIPKKWETLTDELTKCAAGITKEQRKAALVDFVDKTFHRIAPVIENDGGACVPTETLEAVAKALDGESGEAVKLLMQDPAMQDALYNTLQQKFCPMPWSPALLPYALLKLNTIYGDRDIPECYMMLLDAILSALKLKANSE